MSMFLSSRNSYILSCPFICDITFSITSKSLSQDCTVHAAKYTEISAIMSFCPITLPPIKDLVFLVHTLATAQLDSHAVLMLLDPNQNADGCWSPPFKRFSRSYHPSQFIIFLSCFFMALCFKAKRYILILAGLSLKCGLTYLSFETLYQ